MKLYSLLIFNLLFGIVLSQNSSIKGKVTNSKNNEPIPFCNIAIYNTTLGGYTNENGNYEISNVQPGIYTVEISSIGFKNKRQTEVKVSSSKPTILNISLDEAAEQLEAFEVKTSPFEKKIESPISRKTITNTEIERNPGANRDISKVIQSLPGVASGVSFRNDIIIRGGAPNENRFYLDGIEVPNINHFATQGSSGGPVGMINVNFIDEVEFYSSAFPSNRGNALSSVMEFKQKEGNTEKLITTFMLGSSDAGLTFDGPLGKKSNFIFSARTSYLQFLFEALKLPFLPTYTDFQFKNKIYINEKNQVTLIGLGAIDDFSLNSSVNNGVSDKEIIERNNYILGNIPVSDQWNYTFGTNWKHFNKKGFYTIVLSRNHLNNSATKYLNNDESDPNNLLLKYNSQEIENKFRIEEKVFFESFRLDYGINYEYATYTNSTFNKISIGNRVDTIDFSSTLNINKYGGFVQLSKRLFSERLGLSVGLRVDGNDFSSEMSNPLQQFSPRLSLSYSLTEKININGNIGRYYQLPPYTVLGYRNNSNELANKNIKYIYNDHYVLGIDYLSRFDSKIAIESFYKNYNQYPFLTNDSISLANLGADFGIIGNEPATSSSKGRSYGVEFLYQQKMFKGFFGILAYTFVRSEFTDKNNNYIPSSWDNQHLLSLTAGKKLKKNWEIGFKFRYLGGTPYTPFDAYTSSLRQVWDVNNQAVLDYNKINSERLSAFHQLDVRVDKKYYFKKSSLNIYFDIQNLYNNTAEQPSFLLPVLENNTIKTLEEDPNRYELKEVENPTGTVLPSIGIMWEF